MSGNMPGHPHLHHPPAPHNYGGQQHSGRRQNEYHMAQFHPQHFNPYHPYPAPPHHQYYGPPHPQYMPQWYPPYQPYPAPPPPPPQQQHQPHPRHYAHQGPVIVSSQPHAQPIMPAGPRMPPQHTPQPPPSSQTPLPEQSTPSTMSQAIASPSTTPTSASVQTPTPPATIAAAKPQDVPQQTASPAPSEPIYRTPFAYPLPWYSVPDAPFPPKSSRRRRRRKLSDLRSEAPEFPSRLVATLPADAPSTRADGAATPTATAAVQSEQSQTSEAPEALSSQATPVAPAAAPTQRPRAPTRPVVPAVPNISRRPATATQASGAAVTESVSADVPSAPIVPAELKANLTITVVPQEQVAEPAQDAAAANKPSVSSWAGLFNRGKAVSTSGPNPVSSTPNDATNGLGGLAKTGTLAESLRLYNVENVDKISFLEPRGLVNTGNMCYMNSILQTLVFCVPFYDFLDQVSKRAAHSFKSNIPLVEAMIMFMREYQVIDSASSVDQLRRRLKDGELEQYGEAFIPEYVYEAIKRLPRFSSMRRGQQQDAEEFLGLLLEVLHSECAAVMGPEEVAAFSSAASDVVSEMSADGVSSSADAGGWMEVGQKQKPAVTRSSGGDVESPITKIFGGKLRSEFRVSGNKNSVTLTPYQQLQLDIGDPAVSNVIDALKGLTRSERVDGTFQTVRGPQDHGTKQFFIETLPPVLILHLKRFHFEGNTTQKIWKKVGYPLELEIPKEVFAHNKRGQFTNRPQGLPRYRLTGVVYHHGKNASGGHYTVDVRRQEGREWIRLDDTVIRRVRPEDVASEGGEEDPQVLAKALEQHKRDQQDMKKNIFSQAGFADEGDEASSEGGDWSQVNGATTTSPTGPAKKWSGVVNGSSGTGTPAGDKRTQREIAKSSSKDSKVAYILFYEQIRA